MSPMMLLHSLNRYVLESMESTEKYLKVSKSIGRYGKYRKVWKVSESIWKYRKVWESIEKYEKYRKVSKSIGTRAWKIYRPSILLVFAYDARHSAVHRRSLDWVLN